MRLEYFQMIDRISLLDPAARLARAECLVPEHSPIFEGHFPGHPILPGVLMIETMAQIGGWLILATLRFAAMPFLIQAREAKMRDFVPPGRTLIAEAQLLHDGSGFAVVKASLSTNGKKTADAEIRYRVAPFPNDTLRATMLDTARRVGVPEEFLHAQPA